MKIYPKLYCKKVTDISIDYFNENNIKAILLDVDNTLLDFDLNIVEGLKEWYEKVKKSKIKCMILSNSNKTEKVEKGTYEIDKISYEAYILDMTFEYKKDL